MSSPILYYRRRLEGKTIWEEGPNDLDVDNQGRIIRGQRNGVSMHFIDFSNKKTLKSLKKYLISKKIRLFSISPQDPEFSKGISCVRCWKQDTSSSFCPGVIEAVVDVPHVHARILPCQNAVPLERTTFDEAISQITLSPVEINAMAADDAEDEDEDSDRSQEASQRRALIAYADHVGGVIGYDCMIMSNAVAEFRYFIRNHIHTLPPYWLNLIREAFEWYCDSELAGTVNVDDPLLLLGYANVLQKQLDARPSVQDEKQSPQASLDKYDNSSRNFML